jgi:hypothetical protein
MRDLKNLNLIKLKGFLFLFLGLFAGVLLILESPKISTALLLLICVWSFCRAYYFVFYVIEHYVDKEFRFAGLIDFIRYLRRRQIE